MYVLAVAASASYCMLRTTLAKSNDSCICICLHMQLHVGNTGQIFCSKQSCVPKLQFFCWGDIFCGGEGAVMPL